MIRSVTHYEVVEEGKILANIEGNCLSTDDKPVAGIATGSIMVEADTGDVYFFDEESGEWIKQFSFQE